MAETEKLIRIAKELNELYWSKKAALPYSVNVISELHAGENANSRILRGLLQYSRNAHYPILQSFINLLNKLADCDIDISIQTPELTNEQGDRIDLLIKEKKSYAIIIENKIWGARDMETQIERYINYVDGLGIPKRKIFVVYLTSDGNKEISDISLTDKAKKHLGYSDKCNGRFICMNFKDDLMPWLDTLMDSEELEKEPLLSSSITLYVDYLKEIFDSRKEDIEIENELEKYLMEKIQIDSFQDLLKTREDVCKLWGELSSTANKRIKSICEKKVCKALEKKGYNISYTDFEYNNFHLEVKIREWKKCLWAIRSEKNSTLYSGIYNDPEHKVAKKYKEHISSIYEKSNTNGWIGWSKHKDYELSDEFWLSIEAHPTKFVNFIVNEIEWARKETKGMKL